MSLYSVIVKSTNDSSLQRRLSEYFSVCIAAVFPRKHWYAAALKISNVSKFVSHRSRLKELSLGLMRAKTMNTFLALLTRSGKPFPIPYELSGMEHLRDDTRGLILCTARLPLVKVTMRALMENGRKIDAAIAGGPVNENRMAVWGIKEKIPVLMRNASVLLKTKSVLAKKGCVVATIDRDLQGGYSPDLLHLSGKLNAKVVFFFAQLEAGGLIKAEIVLPPHPFCENKEAIKNNIEFLSNKVQTIIQAYKTQPVF